MAPGRWFIHCGLALAASFFQCGAFALELAGESVQGGLIFGTVNPGSAVLLAEGSVDELVAAHGGEAVRVQRPDLEHVFLGLTGRSLRD